MFVFEEHCNQKNGKPQWIVKPGVYDTSIAIIYYCSNRGGYVLTEFDGSVTLSADGLLNLRNFIVAKNQ